MNFEEQQKPQNTSCLNYQSINDENNNLQNSICTNCSPTNHLREEEENERMIIVPDICSDDEYWCSSCSSVNDSELISLDTRKLWHDIAHIIKCVYRETNREFAENHSTSDISKTKEYVQILTQLDSESLFNKIKSIVLEYVDEVRNQVLKRVQTCLKTSNDVQLFISYLLDEYNTFIQAAKNVSTIVSYLEEHYMTSFHLTWLLYNKHLYEKLIYMDKKIQHSMTAMIDPLQTSHKDKNDYSPAEYTQLLNRFLAFDEEMSEVACLYKDCQVKMSSVTRNSSVKNQMGIVMKTKKKKLCKKTKRKQGLTKDNLNSSSTNAVNIPLSINPSTTPTPSQQGSNGSSICSGVSGKESSSISSFDDYLLDNTTSSSSYMKEELDQLVINEDDLREQLLLGILNSISPMARIQQEIDQLNLNESPLTEENQLITSNKMKTDDKTQISNVTSTKKSKSKKSSSNRQKESSTATSSVSSSSSPRTSLTSDLIFPPKPPSSTAAKRQTDIRSLTKTELSTCPSLLSAKIQSASFTAGTFGSITTTESPRLSSLSKQARLNLSLSNKSGLSTKPDSTVTYNKLDFLRQAASPDEFAALLSSLESSKSSDELQKFSSNDKTCDFCCCDLFPGCTSSETNGCVNCMSLPHTTMFTSAFNPRDAGAKERLKLKFNKRIIQNITDEPKATGNKSKMKPCDNNIDDLVRFIDGDEGISEGSTTKKNKKKKEKQMKINSTNEDTQQSKSLDDDAPATMLQPLSKRKQKAKLKLEQQEKKTDVSPTRQSFSPVPPPPLPEKIDSSQTIIEPTSERCPSAIEEEINWITISRKQSKHKPTAVPSLLAAPIIPPNNGKQKRQPTTIKPKTTNTPTLAQPKVISETVSNSNKQKHATNVPTARTQNSVKIQTTHQQKSEPPPSAWAIHEETQVKPSSILLATAPVFVPSSSRLLSNTVKDTLSFEQSPSSLYWDSNDYHPPDSIQQPISSFSPKSGPLNTTASRCIQRPSSEPRTTSFSIYSPINYTDDNSTTTWNDLSATTSNESHWKYSSEVPFQTSTVPDDFPLYDPFNSGPGRSIPSSTLLNNRVEEHFGDLPITQGNDVDEMDALDKEIEDFKKCYIDGTSLDML